MLLVTELTLLVPIFFLQMIQEIIHWQILVGIRVIIPKYDLNYDVSLDFP